MPEFKFGHECKCEVCGEAVNQQENPTTPSPEIDYFATLAQTQGVAVSTVKDGHLMMFKTSWLKQLLESLEKSKQDKCLIFLKQPDFKD